jgi:hypothetical protein
MPAVSRPGTPARSGSSGDAVIQGNFGEDFVDIKEHNPLLTPGMELLHEGGRLAQGGVKGLQIGADIASGPARWAAGKIEGTDSKLKKVGYGALGALGTVVSAPAGILAGGIGAGVGFGTGAAVGGAGLVATTLGGAALAAREGASAISSAARNFSVDNARGIYEPTATHPIYGDRAALAAPAIQPGPSAPIAIPERRDPVDDHSFRPGGPAARGFLDGDLAAPLLSAPAPFPQPLESRPAVAGHAVPGPYTSPLPAPIVPLGLSSASSSEEYYRRSGQPSGIARALAAAGRRKPLSGLFGSEEADAQERPLSDDNLFSEKNIAGRARARWLAPAAEQEAGAAEEDEALSERGLSRPRTSGGAMVSRALPPQHPASAAKDYGAYTPEGGRINYNKEGRKELAEYGVIGTGVAAGAAGKIAYLHGTVSPAAMPATLPVIEGLGGAGGIVGTVSDLIETGKGVSGALNKGADTHGRALSAMHATSSLGSAVKSSSAAAWNLSQVLHSSDAISAGAQAAAGGAAIASGGVDIIRGTYGALRAHDRIAAIGASKTAQDGYVKTAAGAAAEGQQRERTKGVATALKGGTTLAGGILLTISAATPVGWALIGGAAIIGAVAALYNWKKKGETKEKIAAEVLGVSNQWQDYKNEVFYIKKNTTFGTQKRKRMLDALESRTPDPLKASLRQHNFKDAGHFYANYINYTANYLFTEGVESPEPNPEIVSFLTSMGLKVTPPAQPTAEKIAKQLSL